MSVSLRVMHFADTHFGVENYGKLDLATGMNSRLQDLKRSLSRAVELAIKHQADCAVFAGDAFHLQAPRPTEQREFADALRPLLDARIPIVLAAGNHDMPSAKGRAASVDIYRTLRVPGVTVADTPAVHTVECRRGHLKVAAVPFLVPSMGDAERGRTPQQRQYAASAVYRKTLEELALTVGSQNVCPVVLVGHFLVEGATLSPWQHGASTHFLEPTISVSDLQRGPWDYVALGHLHRYQVLSAGSQPPIVYCGSIDRIDIAEAGEARGFVMADVGKGRATHEFVEIDVCRPMLDIFLEVGSEKPTGTVIEALRGYNVEGAIVRLTVACEGGRRGGVDEGQVRAAMKAAQDVSLVYQSLASTREAVTTAAQPADVRAQLEGYLNRPDFRGRKQSLLRAAEPLLQQVTAELDDKESPS